MSDQMKNTLDHQLKHPVRVVILKKSPDGLPFWPIPDPLPPTIDARREYQSFGYDVFSLPGQHNIERGDLLIDNPRPYSMRASYWVYCSYGYLVEDVSVENASCIVVAKELGIYDGVKLPDRIYLANDFIKLHKPNPIDDLDAFVASLTTREICQPRPKFAIIKQSPDGYPFWPIPSSLPPKAEARLVWESMNYHLFCLLGQHNIVCNDLLIGRQSSYYLVKQVSIKENYCFVFVESADVVKLPDRIYLKNDFIQLHEPEPIDDLAEFVASLTIGDVFADQWPPEHKHANIYIFRDEDVILYVGSSTNVYNRIRAHVGIREGGHFMLNTLVQDNLPGSRNWNIDLYMVNSTTFGNLMRYEMQIIKRLCPIINKHGNPCPIPLPMRYKWRWR